MTTTDRTISSTIFTEDTHRRNLEAAREEFVFFKGDLKQTITEFFDTFGIDTSLGMPGCYRDLVRRADAETTSILNAYQQEYLAIIGMIGRHARALNQMAPSVMHFETLVTECLGPAFEAPPAPPVIPLQAVTVPSTPAPALEVVAASLVPAVMSVEPIAEPQPLQEVEALPFQLPVVGPRVPAVIAKEKTPAKPSVEWLISRDIKLLRQACDFVRFITINLGNFADKAKKDGGGLKRALGIAYHYDNCNFELSLVPSAQFVDNFPEPGAGQQQAYRILTRGGYVLQGDADKSPSIMLIYDEDMRTDAIDQAKLRLAGSETSGQSRFDLGKWLRKQQRANMATNENVVLMGDTNTDDLELLQRDLVAMALFAHRVVASNISVNNTRNVDAALSIPWGGNEHARSLNKLSLYTFSDIAAHKAVERFLAEKPREESRRPMHYHDRYVAVMPFLMAEAVQRLYDPRSYFNKSRSGGPPAALWRKLRLDKGYFYAFNLGVDPDEISRLYQKTSRLG